MMLQNTRYEMKKNLRINGVKNPLKPLNLSKLMFRVLFGSLQRPQAPVYEKYIQFEIWSRFCILEIWPIWVIGGIRVRKC